MKIFDKKDIPALDFIIDELCKFSTFTFNTSDLKEGGFLELIKDGYGSLTPEFDENIEFERLFSIIEKFNCAKCVESSPFGASAYIERTPETLQFKQQGGFKKVYSNLIEEKQREDLLKNKEKNDAIISNWKVKTFWYFFAFAIIGTILSLYNFKNSLTPSKNIIELTKKIDKMELELQKLQTSLSAQKNIDSLNIPIQPLNKNGNKLEKRNIKRKKK